MDEMQERIWDTLSELDGETVIRLFTCYHGLQILDSEFEEFLIEEGYLAESEEYQYE